MSITHDAPQGQGSGVHEVPTHGPTSEVAECLECSSGAGKFNWILPTVEGGLNLMLLVQILSRCLGPHR